MVISDIKNRKRHFKPLVFVLILLALWQLLSPYLPSYVLPSPLAIATSLIDQFQIIMTHSWSTLSAALIGLCIATAMALIAAFLMDTFQTAYELFYPLAIISQTVPLIAVAPLFVLWFGFGLLPKVLAVVLVCFFPILINLLKSFRSLDRSYIDLMRSMGANRWQVIHHVKLPGSVQAFFAGLRISATYSVLGAVIGEWLGGASGLGVYLIRSQKAFAASQLFAAILMISLLSLGLFSLVRLCEHLLSPRRIHQSTKEKQKRKEE